jgi:hypothetical protein
MGCAQRSSQQAPGGAYPTGHQAPQGAGVLLRGQISDAKEGHPEIDSMTGQQVIITRPRPFQMASAWARPRGPHPTDQGVIVLYVFEQPLSAADVCGPSVAPNYTGRKVQIELRWPLPPASTHSTEPPSTFGPHIMVGSGGGWGGQRWEGQVRVIDARPDGGTIWLQAADRYFAGTRFRGQLDGDVPFAMCR